MAYEFNHASSQSLRIGSAPVSGVPLTIAFWTRTGNTGREDNGVYVENTGANSRFAVVAKTNGTMRPYAQSLSSNTSFGQAVPLTTLSLNTTYHLAGVFPSNTSRSFYLNGALEASDSANIAVGALNCVSIAETRIPAFPGYGNLRVAEVGIWSTDLTAAEIASLAKGMTCDKVRPQSLVFYAPLVRDLQDVRGGLTITNNNAATVATHPRVYA